MMESEKGDEETIVCFCIPKFNDGRRTNCWYEIDLSSHTKDTKKKKEKKKKKKKKKKEEKRKSQEECPLRPHFLYEVPPDDYGFRFGCAGMGSKVYLIGGSLMESNIQAISSSVHSIDTRIPGGSYQECTRMIGGKSAPLTHAVDGKIYAFGCSIPDSQAQPWAEVFDTTTPGYWSALPDPSDEVLKASTNSCGNLVFYEKENKFLLGYQTLNSLFYFNLATNSYEYGLDIPITQQFLFSTGRHAVVGHILYMFYPPHKCLYAYNLPNSHLTRIIDGLSMPVLQSISDHYNCPPFLFHLGKHKLCLIWSSWRCDSHGVSGPNSGHNIHYFIFHLEGSRQGSFHVVAHNPLDPPYFIGEADPGYLQDCLLIKRAPVGTTAASDSVYPGVERTMLTRETSQDTRLACRVHVSGIPSWTDEKAIKAFFNKLIKNCDSGAVVNIYFNDVKEFAIVEFSCEEEADNAAKRDCVLFEDKKLIIRRPADYKCRMVRDLWALSQKLQNHRFSREKEYATGTAEYARRHAWWNII